MAARSDTVRLCLAAVFPIVACHGAPRDDLLRDLASSIASAPRIDARLSLAPQRPACDTTPCQPSSQAAPLHPSAQAIEIAARAANAIRTAADPDALHAAALIDLLWSGNAGNAINRSISQLTMATRLTTHPATILSDLSAAYLLRESTSQSPRDLLQSIEASSRALSLEKTYAPARFNLAIALDRLGLSDQAARAWSAYLGRDSTSEWASIARAKLRRPSGTNVSEDAQSASLLGWDQLLGRWGSAVERRDSSEARMWLERVAAMADAVTNQGGDASLQDAVRTIRHLTGDSAGMRRLATAHAAYAESRQTYLRADYAAAGIVFDRLRRDRESAPLREWASVFSGATLMYAGRYPEAERRLRAVVARVDARRHPGVAARARWVLGTTLLRAGRNADALAMYRLAESGFVRAHEWENVGAVQFLGAEAALTLGQSTSYRTMQSALQHLSRFRASVWLHDVLHVWSQALANDGFVATAEHLQDEDVGVAERTGRPFLVAESRIGRARLLALINPDAEIGPDVDSATALVATLPQSYERHWLDTDLRLLDAERLARTNARTAVIALDSVIAYFSTVNARVRLVPAFLLRAESLLALGDTAGSAGDLDRVFAFLSETRNSADSLPLPRHLLSRADAVADQLLLRQVRAGQPRLALRYLEHRRLGQEARDQSVVGATDGAIAVEYALIGDTLLAFTVADTIVHLTRTVVSATRLRSTVDHLVTALELRVEDRVVRPDLAQLHRWLITPIRGELGDSGRVLALIATGPVAAVPFAALYDDTRRQYLIEEHPLRLARGVKAADRGASDTARDWQAALVADPAFPPDQFPQLERLPGASDEVRLIATQYDAPVVLAGSAATRPATEAAFRHAAVIHYAGHAVGDDERPDRSLLVLARSPNPDDANLLSAADIEQLDLRRVRLVVLSACQTVRTETSYGGGFDGLAGAFLKAGARGVVGSLWQVDDQLTKPFMVAFHHAYRTSGDGVRALRDAQLEFLRSSDAALRSPAAWTAFRYIGN